jgi:hypothetical protein
MLVPDACSCKTTVLPRLGTEAVQERCQQHCASESLHWTLSDVLPHDVSCAPRKACTKP